MKQRTWISESVASCLAIFLSACLAGS
ncbi:MAG: hypothetical protein RI949_1617, partial [Pseudomonadota bacterium]